MNDVMKQAFEEGRRAAIDHKANSNPYISGQMVLNAWLDGYVDAVEDLNDDGMSGYLLGRCMRKLGMEFPFDKYKATHREFSGYLSQRDREYYLTTNPYEV